MAKPTLEQVNKEIAEKNERYFNYIVGNSEQLEQECRKHCKNKDSKYCEHCSHRSDRANFYHSKY